MRSQPTPTGSDLSRRELIANGAAVAASAALDDPTGARKRVAGITTVYFHNSHADVILSRLLEGENLDGRSRRPYLDLVSLYVDQFPPNDMSRALARKYGVRLCDTIEEAMTLGTGELTVEGVLIVGEHGNYPQNEKGQDLYPRKRFFDAVLKVMEAAGQGVPTFVDKHLSHSWAEVQEMTRSARRIGAPLMAGSSLPGTWRRPAIEVARGAHIQEAVAISYHTLYGYGFHALEMLQCLVERRAGGETGVRRVQCLTGEAVWEAGRQGRYDRSLLEAAIGRVPGADARSIERKVRDPVVFLIEYLDGFRASVFTLNPAIGAWATAWRVAGDPVPKSTLFWTQEARPLGHFTFLVRQIEQFMRTGRQQRPIDRTVLTSGLMDFLLTSKLRDGVRIDTPDLAIRYRPGPAWRDPGPPPPGRPLDQQ